MNIDEINEKTEEIYNYLRNISGITEQKECLKATAQIMQATILADAQIMQAKIVSEKLDMIARSLKTIKSIG